MFQTPFCVSAPFSLVGAQEKWARARLCWAWCEGEGASPHWWEALPREALRSGAGEEDVSHCRVGTWTPNGTGRAAQHVRGRALRAAISAGSRLLAASFRGVMPV